jgi:hypothetical protein
VTPNNVAEELRGFGPLGILAILLILLAGSFPFVPLGAILALVWVQWSRTPWREIGYVRPRSWTRTVALGIVFGIAFKFLMKVIVYGCSRRVRSHRARDYLLGCGIKGGSPRFQISWD